MVETDSNSPTWKFTQYVFFFGGVQLGRADRMTSHMCALYNLWYQLLTSILRCFGDKGDVEDITEGKTRAKDDKLRALVSR